MAGDRKEEAVPGTCSDSRRGPPGRSCGLYQNNAIAANLRGDSL